MTEYIINEPGSSNINIPDDIDEGDKLIFNNTSTGRDGEIIEFNIPAEGKYKITAKGARGADAGADYRPGYGAVMQGTFEIEDDLIILVGQKGEPETGGDGNAGGGGTFVVIKDDSGKYTMEGNTYSNQPITPLVVAGGGGGSWNSSPIPEENRDGQTHAWNSYIEEWTAEGGFDYGDGGSGEGAGGGLISTGYEDDGGRKGAGGGSFLYGHDGDGDHGKGGEGDAGSGSHGGFGGGGGYGSFNYGSGGGGFCGGNFCEYDGDGIAGGGSFIHQSAETGATSNGEFDTSLEGAENFETYEGEVENLDEYNKDHGQVIIEVQELGGSSDSYTIIKRDRDTFTFKDRFEYDKSYDYIGKATLDPGSGVTLSDTGMGEVIVPVFTDGKYRINSIDIDTSNEAEETEEGEITDNMQKFKNYMEDV